MSGRRENVRGINEAPGRSTEERRFSLKKRN